MRQALMPLDGTSSTSFQINGSAHKHHAGWPVIDRGRSLAFVLISQPRVLVPIMIGTPLKARRGQSAHYELILTQR